MLPLPQKFNRFTASAFTSLQWCCYGGRPAQGVTILRRMPVFTLFDPYLVWTENPLMFRRRSVYFCLWFLPIFLDRKPTHFVAKTFFLILDQKRVFFFLYCPLFRKGSGAAARDYPPHFTVFHHPHHFAWVKSHAISSKILNVIVGPSSSRSSNWFPQNTSQGASILSNATASVFVTAATG